MTVLVPIRMCYPFQFSSMPKGEVARHALYTIIEDVVAVEGPRELDSARPLTSDIWLVRRLGDC